MVKLRFREDRQVAKAAQMASGQEGLKGGASLQSPPSQPASYGGPSSGIWEDNGFL